MVRASMVAALALALSLPAHAREDPSPHLGFERAGAGDGFAAWTGKPSGPAATIALDSTVVHGGRYAARLRRVEGSESPFSSIGFKIPVDFRGSQVELRGWLRMDSVSYHGALWQRQDGRRAPSLQFDNMGNTLRSGTTDWQEVRVTLPLDARADTIIVGALLAGTGTLWVDDLSVLVDGVPVKDLPVYVPPLTVFDSDHEFDGNSRIHPGRLTGRQVDDLVLLARVWGFLKYHHPEVVEGRRHWDYDLFRVMPKVLAARDRREALASLDTWVASIGEAPPCTTCASARESLTIRPRLEWISDAKRLGPSLSRRLATIHARRQARTTQHFVSMMPGVGNGDFSNDVVYPLPDSVDAGYRMLSLFRFWNIVEYWSPYVDVVGAPWESILREHLPRLVAAASRPDYEREMIALVARVNDTHTNLWGALREQPPKGRAQLPVIVRFIEGRATVTGDRDSVRGPASGLRRGDVIEAIDGVDVKTLVGRWSPLYAASNEPTRLRDIARNLTRGDSGSVRLRIDRDGHQQTLDVERVPTRLMPREAGAIHDLPGPVYRRISDDIAYLKLSAVKVADCSLYVARSRGTRLWIVDIRNYPSEFVVFDLGGRLIANATPFARFSIGDLSSPGGFALTSPPLEITPIAPRYEGRVAILVDEVSQSQAEYTTMALRSAPGAVVVGSTTAGADGNVSRFALPGGVSTMISGIGVFYADGRPTQRIGIVPDLEVRPTRAGILAGRDELIEAAVRHVLGRDLTAAEREAMR
ncbi:MAG TPA: S41 family peptidase [Candidatus Eisenbacteria bacterium]|nr:S41 family peptidase [Candidatus Eisenbacteria bacterium]